MTAKILVLCASFHFTLCAAENPRAAAPKRLIFNQDSSEFFIGSFGPVRPATLDSYIQSIGGKAVTDLFICVNAQRTNFKSAVWESDWDGYDPKGGDNQPFFAGIAPDRAFEREWTRLEYEWAKLGVDYPARALAAARANSMHGWISIRMNDAHYATLPAHPYHSTFWREHPDWRLEGSELDYSRKEVRDYYLALIREVCMRFPMYGLELDFMRHGHYFQSEAVHEGRSIMTDFVKEVRRIAGDASKKRGARIKIAVRVPSTPWIAAERGLDAVAWAKARLVDLIVASPWWASTQSDIPVETWRGLLAGTGVDIAVALEDGISSGNSKRRTMTVEESRGVALAALQRGADAIYLFNLFTGPIQQWSRDDYKTFLSTASNSDRLRDLPRRFPVTLIDPWAAGEPRNPKPLSAAGLVLNLRIPIGPLPRASDTVTIALGVASGEAPAMIHVNEVEVVHTGRDGALDLYAAPVPAMQEGYNLVRVERGAGLDLNWAEIRIKPKSVDTTPPR